MDASQERLRETLSWGGWFLLIYRDETEVWRGGGAFGRYVVDRCRVFIV